jgi:predicted amidohydrolase YtcJ
MHTRDSAYQLHQETFSGRLRVGMAADLVLLDRDILGVPLTQVSQAKTRLTLVGGRATYRNGV